MKKTNLTAEVRTYDLFGNTTTVQFPVYVDNNERLYAKVLGDYMSIFHPDLVKNNIRILGDNKR